jgi:hypothetical protein
LPAHFVPQISFFQPKKKRGKKLRRVPHLPAQPIGLIAVEAQGWLNALMQFILFIGRFVEIFYFAPKSFFAFREFIEQYHDDQEDAKAVSSANGASIYQFLSLQLKQLNLMSALFFLQQALGARWRIIENVEAGEGEDLFVLKGMGKKQFFVQGPSCYELDAFIEMRMETQYVAYVKIGGNWYQCDDDQIAIIQSNCLMVPMSRAILFHYKKKPGVFPGLSVQVSC